MKKVYANKFESTDEIDKFIDIHKIQTWHKKKDNLNKQRSGHSQRFFLS